jgi:hypothetical protein
VEIPTVRPLRILGVSVRQQYGSSTAAVRQALTDAERNWASDLRRIRDEITHCDVGDRFVHNDGRISYSHGSLGTPTYAYGIDRILDEIQKYETARSSGDLLKDTPRLRLCEWVWRRGRRTRVQRSAE